MTYEINPDINKIVFPETSSLIFKWQHIRIDEIKKVFLFYQIEDKISGFDFYVASNVELQLPYKINYCHPINCIIYGRVYYDGIRHLYYGDEQTDNYGYHYYPDIDLICLCLKVVNDLAKKHGWEDK